MFAQAYFYFDTMLMDSTESTTSAYESILKQHPLLGKTDSIKELVLEKPKISNNKTGIFMMVVGLLLLVGLMRSSFNSYISSLWSVIINFSVIKRQTKEQIQNNVLASTGFRLLFFMGLSLLIMAFLSQKYRLDYSSSFKNTNLWLCIGLLIALYYLKRGFLTGVGWIYNKPEASEIYFFNSNVMNEVIGLLVFPIALLMFLLSGFLFQAFMILGISILLGLIAYKNIKIFKGIKNLLRISAFDYLLYLCAFEIMPLMILMKVLSGFSF